MLWKYDYIELNGEKRVCGYCSFDDENPYGIPVPTSDEFVDVKPPKVLMDEYDQPLYILDENNRPVLKPIETNQAKIDIFKKNKIIEQIKSRLPEILYELSEGGTFEDLKTKIKEIKIKVVSNETRKNNTE